MQDNFHEIYTRKFPFTIVYQVIEESNIILVIAIYHQNREPLKKYRE
jgi:mRNA-degrading endonuclease RelE of RelBE toxin-antitoxin system